MIYRAIALMFLLLLPLALLPSVMGAETINEVDTKTVLSDIETKKLIIEENAKTRAEIKEHLERKTIDYNKNTQTMIEKNFQVLDERLDGMIRNAGFKVGVIWFSSIILAGSLLMWINRKVNKKAIYQSQIHDKRFGEQMSIDSPVKPVARADVREPEKKPVKEPKKKPDKVLPPVSELPPVRVIIDVEDKMPSMEESE